MKWVLAVYSLLFYSAVGQAYLIGDLDPGDLPPQSCEIHLYTDTPRYFECSGTVVAPRKFVTAAHCAYGQNITRATIFCPGQDPVPVATVGGKAAVALNPGFRSTGTTTIDCSIAPYDVAVVTTAANFAVEPMKLPANTEEAVHIFNDPTDCNVYGYGLDKSGKTGTHAGADADIKDWLISTIIHTLDGVEVSREPVMGRLFCGALAHFTGKIVQSGDSGGALVCKDHDGVPILAGVNQGDNPEKRDNIVTTFAKNLEWVKDQMRSSDPSAPHLASLRRGQAHARIAAPIPTH